MSLRAVAWQAAGQTPAPTLPTLASRGTTISSDRLTQGVSVGRVAGLQVRCPQCHSPNALDADAGFTDIVCTSCGSQFSLAAGPDATALPADARIGHFELIEPLGAGGFGAVWKAVDTELDRTVAVKLPRRGQLSPAEIDQFFREARAAAQLRHPNIVSVHEVGRQDDTVFIVSDLVDGQPLSAWLATHRLTSREAAALCGKLAEALHHAHEAGVVHRDLKPANILIDADGQPHITDFGLAKREVEITVTQEGQLMGTPAYMSPEQAQGQAHQLDRRSDIYSLGVILFELLTGERPFRGNARMLMHQIIHDEPPSPRKLNGYVPRDLETICLKCLQKEPAGRYATAADLAEEMDRFGGGEPIRSRPIGRAARAWRWCRRKPVIAALSAAVVLLLLTLGIGGPVVAAHQVSLRRTADASAREASDNFQMALDPVNKLGTDIAEDPRLKTAGLEKLRQSLLRIVRDFYKRFVGLKPSDPQLRAEQGRALVRLGTINRAIGDQSAAVETFAKAAKLFKDMLPGQPDDVELLAALAKALTDLAAVYGDTDKNDLAEQAHLEAEAVYEQLARLQPAVLENEADRAKNHVNLARLLGRSGSTDQATQRLLAALKVFQRLANGADSDFQYHTDLTNVYLILGGQYADLNRIEDAVKACKKAIDIHTELAGLPTAKPDDRHAWAIALDILGVLYTDHGLLDEAVGVHGQSIGICDKLVNQSPDVPKYRVALASASLNLGRTYWLQHQFADAEVQWKRAATIYEQLVQDFRGVPQYRNDLCGVYMSLVEVQAAKGMLDKADQTYKQLLAIMQPLVNAHPTMTEYATTLVGGQTNYGWILLARGDTKSAIGHFNDAIETGERVIGNSRALARTAQFLCGAYVGRAQAWTMLQPPVNAASDLARAGQLNKDPSRAAILKTFYAPALTAGVDQALSVALDGKHEQALALVERLAPLSYEGRGDLLYKLAAIYAQIAGAIDNDHAIAQKQREGDFQRYAARAVTLLKQAQNAGVFKDPAAADRLAGDPDFSPLIGQAAFGDSLDSISPPP